MTTEPAWLVYARTLLGTREAPGAANNPAIMGWARKVAGLLGAAFNGDATPWCGLFCAYVMKQTGIAPPAIALRAKSWATWGQPVQPQMLMPGTVLVFERPGGGHVSLYTGESATAYRCLGGNQGDAVSEVWILKSRCVARRWPKDRPMVGGPVRLTASGKVSEDEA